MNYLLLAVLAFMSLEAAACGVCIDDKIASCYDHAVLARAKQRGHAVAFFAIQGDIVRDPETRRDVNRAIDGARGVLRGTARVSLENAALSFAYDPARTSANEAAQAIGRALARHRLQLALLRVMS